MLIKICFIAALLSLLGYLRSTIEEKKPEYLLKPSSILKDWHSENTWVARFSPLFAVLIFIFNLFAWGVYGFTSIFEFVAFVVKKLWWLMLWCWYEVFHPTVFVLFRYLWQYLVVFSWKFFNFAFAKIPESVKKDNIFYALKKLLLFGAVLFIAIVGYLLTINIFVLVISSLIVFYLFQFTVFTTITYYRSDDLTASPVFPGIRISIFWMAIATVSTALLVLITKFSDVYIISGLSVILIQILLPMAVLFGLASLATTFYLPAFIKENGPDVDVLKFLKACLFRFPKLCFSQAFQLIGLLILSIIPIIILLLFNVGIKQVTERDLPAWAEHVVVMDYHIPSISTNYLATKELAMEQTQLMQKSYSIEDVFKTKITSSKTELEEAIILKSNIRDNEIHTFERKAFVNENQSFSIPAVEECTGYEWRIRDAVNNVEIKRVNATKNEIPGSLLFYHQWKKAGSYIVSLVPKRKCGSAKELSINVEVIDQPTAQSAGDGSSEMFALPVTKYFATREAADYAMKMINDQIHEYNQEQKEALKEYDNQGQIFEDRINLLNLSSKDHVQMLIAKILGLLGLILMGILFLSVIWTYLVTYHYDMFGFEQEGKHYWVSLLEEIKGKNPNQPLLGLFVLIIVSLIIVFREYCCYFFTLL